MRENECITNFTLISLCAFAGISISLSFKHIINKMKTPFSNTVSARKFESFGNKGDLNS